MYEFAKIKWPKVYETFGWMQIREYVAVMGKLPPLKYTEGDEGYGQWTYNPRTKKGRELRAKTLRTKAVPARKEPTQESLFEEEGKA